LPSWRTIAVVAAVVVVGTVVTVATAGAAGPLVVGAVASVGLTGTAATVATGVAVGAIAGAVGGAAAGAAGEATRQTVNSKALGLGNEEFSGTKIVDAAVKEGKTGALIGAAVGGVAALAATATGAAAVGAVGKLAQRVAPNLSKAAVAAGRGLAGAATAVAKRTGLTALEKASEKAGFAAAKSLFKEGTAGAKAVATFADTGSVADTFAAKPARAAEPPPAAAQPTESDRLFPGLTSEEVDAAVEGARTVRPIGGYSGHGLDNAIGRNGGRGVSARAYSEAQVNPKSVIMQEPRAGYVEPTLKFTGKRAGFVLNEQGKVITVTGKARGPQQWFDRSSRPVRPEAGAAQRRANALGFSYLKDKVR
jgi:hypothetical protein